MVIVGKTMRLECKGLENSTMQVANYGTSMMKTKTD